MLKKFKLPIISIAAALALFAGCIVVIEFEVLSEPGDAYLSAYVTPTSEESVNITMSALATIMDTDPTSIQIIDWRSSTDFAAGHLIGAINWSKKDLDDKITDGSLKALIGKTIINVCYTGQTASFATAIMNLLGQDEEYDGLEAKNVVFGMCGVLASATQWTDAISSAYTASLETTANTTTQTYDYPEVDTGETTLAGIIAAQLDDAAEFQIGAAEVFADPSQYFIVNYWPADQYADPGHIAGAYQFTPKTSLLTTSTLNLLPTDQTIVVYCYTSQTSSQVVAYLRLLGYDAKSLKFGIEGFAHDVNPGSKFTAPSVDYSSYIE